MSINFHPLVNNGLIKGDDNFSGGKLHCQCSTPVEVVISSNVAHTHLCGCSKCWKPSGALFSIVAAVTVDNLKVTSGEDKLYVVDPDASIQRRACKDCGVHMFGRIEKDSVFKGFDIVHPELADKTGWQEPQFAGFVSSIVEAGFDPTKMEDVRKKLQDIGLQPYDCMSPPMMDAVAHWIYSAKQQAK